MTRGDVIRSMDDETLATLFTEIISARDHLFLEKLKEKGIEADLIEFPLNSWKKHLNWLKGDVNET